jgi:DNA-binding response OmpR family regulator
MLSSCDEVEKLLGEIRAAAPGVTRLTDQISVLCRAQLAPVADDPWAGCGLTRLEARLMRCLHDHIGRIVPKTVAMDALYFDRPHDEPGIKIVDILVCKIRRKIAGGAHGIETVWGRGYRLRIMPHASTGSA